MELLSTNNKITTVENTHIQNVLKEYSIEPLKIEKIRSVYKITTENKLYCLKKLKHGGIPKAQKGYNLSKHLIANSFYGVVKYIKTNESKIYLRYRHNIYYVTNWIKGREVNYDDYDEVKKCFSFMAEFHSKAAGFVDDNKCMPSKLYDWPKIFLSEKNFLFSLTDIIQAKKIKTNFDCCYISNIPKYLDLIDQCLDLINSSSYQELCQLSETSKTVCHDSFYYQNLIVKNNGKMFLIDLDSAIYDIIPYDIGKLLRRLLYKSNYNWNFELAKELIESYMDITPLNLKELELLLIFIIFPQKFCKLGRKRYVNREEWCESKYMQKLNRVVKNIEAEQNFIHDYKNYFLTEFVKE